MTTTTSYGTWQNRIDTHAASVKQTVIDALGSYASGFDVDAIVDEYRSGINSVLDAYDIVLVGNEFIGPADGEPVALRAIVHVVNLWAIIEKYDPEMI